MSIPNDIAATQDDAAGKGLRLLDLVVPLIEHLKLLVVGSLAVGLAALGITYAMSPSYTARTTFMPPQQQQGIAASALASVGALAGLAGGLASVKTPADQYIGLMQSVTVADRLINEFKLMDVYEAKYRSDARKALSNSVKFTVGRKDGLISVEVSDEDPTRAAAMANRYVDELRQLTSKLAITEAQQRRVFFEDQLKQTQDRLTSAQHALQASGFSQGAIKAEPRAAADAYARLKAEVTAAEVRLQTLRRGLAESAPEVQQQLTTLVALRSQLARLENSAESTSDADYVTRYREFKYQETLFDLFARQYEIARVDESREGVLIQVVDAAQPPERRTSPRRAFTAVAATVVAAVLLCAFIVVRHLWREAAREPDTAERVARLRAALGRK